MRRTIKRCGILLSLLAVLVAVAAPPRIEQMRSHRHPGRNYSEAIIRDQPLLTLKGHTRLVNRAAFSPDGARIASAGGDGDATVKIWNSQTAALLFTLKGHHRGVYNLAFSPDGKQVASSGAGQMVNLWDADNAKALSTFKGQTMPAFSLDGKRLVSSGLDQTVNIWNLVD